MAARRRNVGNSKRGGGRRRGPGCLSVVLLFLFVVVAAVTTVMIFFSIRTIEVAGNDKYTAEEIRTSSGIKVGDNLVMFNKFKVINRLFDRLPYIEEIRIFRHLPDTLYIDITESRTIAKIESDRGIWLMSAEGKLLELASLNQGSGLIAVEGAQLVKPVAGDLAVLEGDDSIRFGALTDTLLGLIDAGIEEEVDLVDISRVYNVEFEYKGRFRVKLGMPESIDYKLDYLKAIVGELEANQTGIIDLSELIEKEVARFIPYTR